MEIVVNTSGDHGRPGQDGIDGRSGGNGQHGTHGTHATSARPVAVTLGTQEGSDDVLVSDTAPGPLRHRPIALESLSSTSVVIAARGGDGGRGGHGGDGGRGLRGTDGADATRYSSGGNGGPGGDGGNGGDGGAGGAAGSGASVTLNVPVTDTDLLMLIGSVDISAGLPGPGGSGGDGGAGGAGGSGGSSYSWTESYQTTSSNGNGSTTTTTHYTYHSNPGGCSGPRGRDGRGGARGTAGAAAAPGSYTIRVLASGVPGAALLYSAPERYNVALVEFEPVGSPDGILEPGEEFTLRGVTLLNNGFMPTPVTWPVIVAPSASEWIELASEPTRVREPIEPGFLLKLDHLPPLRFRIRHAFPLVPNVIPCAMPRLAFDVFVSRVNRRFRPADQAEGCVLEIRYPLQLSLVYGARAITLHEEAPLVFILRNVCTAPSAACMVTLGTSSPLGPVVEWRRLPDIDLGCEDSPALLKSPVQWTFPVGALAPGASALFRGTVRFVNPSTPPYSRVIFDARLTLAHTGRTIQVSDTTVQLGQEYAFDDRSDFILIASSSTTAEQVARWRKIAFMAGTRLSVWNVSLYGGMSFGFVRRDGGSFTAQLPGRVLIVLNEPYALDASRRKTIIEGDVLLEEIYVAAQGGAWNSSESGDELSGKGAAIASEPARAQGIHSLIVTDVPASTWNPFAHHGVRLQPSLIDVPHARGLTDLTGAVSAEGPGAMPDAVRLCAAHREPARVTTPRRTFFSLFSRAQPTPRHIETVAETTARVLHRAKPTEQHVILHQFNPAADEVKKGCATTTTSLGSLRVFKGLSTVAAQLGTTHPRCSDEQLAFAACKLLPFERKLACLAACHSKPDGASPPTAASGILVRCILSDLADEQWAWRQHKWSGEWPRSRLREAVHVVIALAASEFYGPLLSCEEGKSALMWLLAQYCALLDIIPSLGDRLCFFRRRRILSSVCLSIVRPLIARLPSAEFAAARKAACDTLRPLRRSEKKRELWAAVRNPMSDSQTRYQHWERAAVFAAEDVVANAGVVPPIARCIVETPHVYAAGEIGDARRKEALGSFEQVARSDERPVNHYAVKPREVAVPDNLAAVRVFNGVVRR